MPSSRDKHKVMYLAPKQLAGVNNGSYLNFSIDTMYKSFKTIGP